MSLQPFTPPLRFSTLAFSPVDTVPQANGGESSRASLTRENTYRGAYPKTRNLSYLSRLHLRTILSLTPRPLDNDAGVKAWAGAAQPIHLVHVRCEKPKDESGGLTREGAARAISIMLDRRNYPLYVHCLDGVEVTNTLIACMRKVQAWSSPAILSELGRALRDSSSSEWTQVPSHLSAFLTKFGQPDGLRLPPRNHIPSWLWPAPSPLAILTDPYAWAHSSSHSGQHDLNGGVDRHSLVPPVHPLHASRRENQLPIQHPSLKLYFDTDPDLPPPPPNSFLRPITPLRPQHSRASSTSTGGAQTPPHSLSRPASRAGRVAAGSALSRSVSQAPIAEGLAKRLSYNQDGSPQPRTLVDFRESLLHPLERQESAFSLDGSVASTQASVSVATFLEEQLSREVGRYTPVTSLSPLASPSISEGNDRAPLSTSRDALPGDDFEVSTPRARPSTVEPLFPGKTDLFRSTHHGQGNRSFLHQGSHSQSAAPVLSQHMREDGEQTPTKAKFGSASDSTKSGRALHEPITSGSSKEQVQSVGQGPPSATVLVDGQAEGTKDIAESALDSAGTVTSEGEARRNTTHMYLGNSDDQDTVKETTAADAEDGLDSASEEQTRTDEAEETEEEEDDEEEEEEDEEEDEEEEDEEDDLALEALDLEGY